MTDSSNTRDPDAAVDALRDAVQRATSTAAEQVAGTELVPTSGPENAVEYKRRLGAAHIEMNRARMEVATAQQAAKDAIEKKKRELDAMVRSLEAELAPMKAQMARMEDGIHAFNIYLGRDEEVIPLRGGEPAPADTPVVLRQMTLYADEEAAIMSEEGGIDFQGIDLFANWLREDFTRINTMLPEPKGVVAFQPRRDPKDYGDPWVNMEKNKLNLMTWWLIRNGERAYLTTTDFRVGANVIPTTHEFTSIFERRDPFTGETVKLQPGTPEWTRAENAADLRTRHFMKVALLLQGLADRTTVFQPLPDGFSFLDQEQFDNGTIQMVADAELSLTTGRQPFREWHRDRMKNLEPGMRVVFASSYGSGFRQYDDQKNYERANVTPQGTRPEDGVYKIKAATDGSWFDFTFAFDRHGEIWDPGTWSYRAPKTKATAKFSIGDSFIVPLDTVTSEEIEMYLGARTERHAYQSMFPILQAALKVKRQEAEAERPFRDALAGMIASLGDQLGETSLAAATVEADELITWFKTGNKWHRPLSPEDAKASKLILQEARRRRVDEGRAEDVITAIRSTWRAVDPHREIMLIARRTTDYVAVIPETRRYPAAAVSHRVFATLAVFNSSGELKETRPWSTFTRSQISRWTTLMSDPLWTEWQFGVDRKVRLTDDEIHQVLASVQASGHDRLAILRWSEMSTTGFSDRVVEHLKVEAFWAGAGTGYPGAHVKVTLPTPGVANATIGRLSQYEFDQHRDELHWETKWADEIGPGKHVYLDQVVVDEMRSNLQAARVDEQKARVRTDEAWTITRSIQAAWLERAWAEHRARYVDDFGSDEFWEQHKAGVTKPPRYPHTDSPYGHGNRTQLFDLVRQLLLCGDAPYGLTVRDALVLLGDDTLTVADDILDLTFVDGPAT